MNSTVQIPGSKTTSFWTNEKHVNYLNTMEASFVRTMLENKGNCSFNHNRQILRLDRNLPDSSESTLDLKSQHRRRTRTHHTPADLMDRTTRIKRRRQSQPLNSSHDQVVPETENESKGAAYNGEGDKEVQN
ncbi:uncharacterized protein [Cicer arietinum]|uniref:Uncharacterized protein LOC101506614 n=1 Tax=Cicer arietinum TaxID=3827 RepID=A0A1S2Z627_CICAR|nr:uncharacterized protein LOC101506614 [Cicer arietinum]